MKDALYTFIGMLLGLVIAPIVVLPIILLDGWYIRTLWNWIAVPGFHLPLLTLPLAIGVALLIQAVHPTTGSNSSDGRKSKSKAISSIIVGPLVGRYGVGLLIAFVVKHYI
jgi:hypothetical protein